VLIAQKTIQNLHNGISTETLDYISSKVAVGYNTVSNDYSLLAARILVSNLHKTTPDKFSVAMEQINSSLDIISQYHMEFIRANANALDSMIDFSRDYYFDYVGYKILELSYLMHVMTNVTGSNGEQIYTSENGIDYLASDITVTSYGVPVIVQKGGINPVTGVIDPDRVYPLTLKQKPKIVDRPQYIYMRIAIAVCITYPDPLSRIKKYYDLLSQMYFIHATPTLYNSCTRMQQLNSCFLLGTDDDISSIMKTASNTAEISKWAGGIGIHMSNIRGRGSLIKGTNGHSSGLPPQIRIYDAIGRCFNQGGKRPGVIAIYVEPWHCDILQFLAMKLNQGDETQRARDLFYALWVPDLFMERCNTGTFWSLFNINTAPGLSDVYDGMIVCTKCNYCDNSDYQRVFPTYGRMDCKHEFTSKNVFTELYTRYEREGRAVGTLLTSTIVNAICTMQRESGIPYICFKDNVNRQSNQNNIGTIKSSNLCTEIMEWSSNDSYACCTLASVNLKKYIINEDSVSSTCNSTGTNTNAIYSRFDFDKLHETVQYMVQGLDTIIEVNNYPVIECVENSKGYRPIGIGIQGLADVFAILRIPYLSKEAEQLDLAIMETIYHAAITQSVESARVLGPYTRFKGSPASYGLLQYDLWVANQRRLGNDLRQVRSNRYDWDALSASVKAVGLRHSLHIALMPTVSTSQIMGNIESFEPCQSNIYVKTTSGGKFTITNTYMIQHLTELGLWTPELCNRIITDNGSVQAISEIPKYVREIYKTITELPQRELMKRAALREAFVDQAQSLNINITNNTNPVLRGIMMTGWKLGLKTGSYYIRTQPALRAMKNNISVTSQVCSIECTSCSS
jgi:ribonucleoside-diphosphate reductase alpha chain